MVGCAPAQDSLLMLLHVGVALGLLQSPASGEDVYAVWLGRMLVLVVKLLPLCTLPCSFQPRT